MSVAKRLVALLLAGLVLLAASALAQGTGVAEQLLAAESLPKAQRERRLALLEAVQASPGSDEELERLFLLATTYGQESPPEPERWQAWAQQAPAPRQALGPWMQQLAELSHLIDKQQFRRARELADTWPQAPAGATRLWRLRALQLRAIALEETGQAESALLLLLEAAPMAEAEGPPWRTASHLSQLANAYSRMGQHERALATAREALLIAQKQPDADLLSRQHAQLSIVLSRAGQHEASRVEGEKALAQARLANDPDHLALQLANQADSYLKLNRPARALELTEEAYPLALEARSRGIGPLSLTLHNRGMALIQLGRVAEGKQSIRRSVTLDLQSGGTTYAVEGLLELGDVLKRAGDLPGAYEALREARELEESVSSQLRAEALAEAQQRFDTAQRSREAERLRQRNAAQAEALRAERLRLGLTALALVCGALLLWLAVLLLRRMRRTNAELAHTNQALAEASERDPLTGLGNRRRLQSLLREAGHRDPSQPLGLILLDIDHFKGLNDQHGHAAGDAVLRAVAGRMRSAVREPGGVIRWGGEEFLVVLPGADAALTSSLAQRLLDVIGSEPVALRDGHSIPVRCSMGVTALPLQAPALGLEQGIDLVDALMYRAKSHGRNQAWCLQQAELPDLPSLLHALGDPDSGSLDLQRLVGPRAAEGLA